MNSGFLQSLELTFWNIAIAVMIQLRQFRQPYQQAMQVKRSERSGLALKTILWSLIGLTIGFILGYMGLFA